MSNVGHELVEQALQGDKTLVVRGQTLKQCVDNILRSSPRYHRLSEPEKRLIRREIRDSLQSLIRDEKLFWRRGQKGRLKVGLVRPDNDHIARRTERMVRQRGYTPGKVPIRRAAKRRIVLAPTG